MGEQVEDTSSISDEMLICLLVLKVRCAGLKLQQMLHHNFTNNTNVGPAVVTGTKN